MDALREAVVAALAVAGGFFCFVAGLGVLRMPDLYVRMHASSKAGTLGGGLCLLAVALRFDDVGITARAIATVVFLMLSAPVGAHMIGRAAYRAGVPLWERSVRDEWREAGPGGGATGKR